MSWIVAGLGLIMLVGPIFVALVARHIVGLRVTQSKPVAPSPWAKVALMGHVEHIGAMHEMVKDGVTWIELLTIEGMAIRVQPGAVYSIKRVPFLAIESDVARGDAQVIATMKASAEARRGRENEVQTMTAWYEERITHLRQALIAVRDDTSENATRDNIVAALQADVDKQDAQESEGIPF